MNKNLDKLVLLMNEVQVAALGDVGPHEEQERYVEDVRQRVRRIEKGLAVLKKEIAEKWPEQRFY